MKNEYPISIELSNLYLKAFKCFPGSNKQIRIKQEIDKIISKKNERAC